MSICLLHLNELPLGNLMQYLDGVTLGSHNFSGKIVIQVRLPQLIAICVFIFQTTVFVNYEVLETKTGLTSQIAQQFNHQ